MDAVIFDFDGTLVDSEGIHDEALRAACGDAGLETRAGAMIGLPDPVAVLLAFVDAGREPTPVEVETILARKRALVRDVIVGGDIPLYPGVRGLLDALVVAGVPVAVCSAARRDEIEPVLRAVGLDAVFAAIVAVEDVPQSKPDPTCYVLTAEKLGVQPDRCVAIEDSIHGVRSARDAGMCTIAVAHTTSSERLVDAHLVAKTIGELHPALLRDIHGRCV